MASNGLQLADDLEPDIYLISFTFIISIIIYFTSLLASFYIHTSCYEFESSSEFLLRFHGLTFKFV